MQQQTIDVIGVILEIQPTSQLTLRDGNQKDKRSLVIGDESNTSISLTLWGEVCDRFDLKQGDIVAF